MTSGGLVSIYGTNFTSPASVLLTEAKRSDVKPADSFTLNPGSIVTMDRGYSDCALFGRRTLAGVFFVTRFAGTNRSHEGFAVLVGIWIGMALVVAVFQWIFPGEEEGTVK